MEEKQLEGLKYPIGRFSLPETPDQEAIAHSIAIIEGFPTLLGNAVVHLYTSQLETPYRQGGWTVKQLIHHIADSHTNAYVRFKWGLTEDRPQIKVYKQDGWAGLADGKDAPVELSLNMLTALHEKWVYLLKGITPTQWERAIFHPGFGKEISLAQLVCQYAWHCDHHLAHITNLIEREGWS
ncbi:YfiT family bacillithiol transferase [Robertkochia sediminum]|uniref:YfiT family bacillithiol transferase n=1 Tax=Robertkochia sediminum TaxID=2785326 RepID=UPI001932768D|nr:putative metal-dependent hydrolase [Robertkochia sediminum]MBL7472584.1 putative metal-dependent hydrolase [Robertkochia sediminum]